ncbi:hypothetical protein Hanom_Chr14g01293661 [Helianthus anomalus]
MEINEHKQTFMNKLYNTLTLIKYFICRNFEVFKYNIKTKKPLINYRTHYQMFTSINEQTRPLFMFVHLTKRTEFLVCVRLFNKRTNELPIERFTNCSPNVWFVCSPTHYS